MEDNCVMVGETVWLPRMDWLAVEPVTVSHVIYIVLFLVSRTGAWRIRRDVLDGLIRYQGYADTILWICCDGIPDGWYGRG